MGIRGLEVAPGAQDDDEVFGEAAVRIDVIVNQFILLGEGEESRVG